MTTAQQVVYERPPEGLARGKWPAPWWVILLLAGTIVIASAVFLIVRFVVGRRLARGPAQPPGP